MMDTNQAKRDNEALFQAEQIVNAEVRLLRFIANSAAKTIRESQLSRQKKQQSDQLD